MKREDLRNQFRTGSERKRKSCHVSQTDPAPTAPHNDIAFAAAEASLNQSKKGFGNLVERITPWLAEIGNWIFAGLIAFILIIMASLITVGPVDPAITIATVAFALALPLNLAGLVLLRLVQDTARIGFADEWAHAFRDAGFPIGEPADSPQAVESLLKRRIRIALLYSFAILALSVLLTLTGLIAALWHMAWWIAVAFFAMAVISLGIVVAALITLRSPESPEQKERNRRYWEEMMRRAKEQSTTNNERASTEQRD
jgi:MFS family permease